MTDAAEDPRWELPPGLKPPHFVFLGREEMFDVWHDMRDGDLLLVTDDPRLFAQHEYVHARNGRASLGDVNKMDPHSMCVAHQILEKYYDGDNSGSQGQSESREAAEG